MKTILGLLLVAVLGAQAYPSYYPYYGTNMDSISYGASDSSQGAMVLNRYYQPQYPRALGGGMAAFMFQQPHRQQQPANQDYYSPDRRRQTTPETSYVPPQQNEVFYPQAPEETVTARLPELPTQVPELADATEKTELLATTLKTVQPEIIEPEIEEIEEQKPRKRVSKKKQVKRPVDDEEEDDYAPRMPAGAFFPMYFGGWGGRSQGGGGAPGVMAIANAYSTGRGGVSSSHATAYGPPTRSDEPTKL